MACRAVHHPVGPGALWLYPALSKPSVGQVNVDCTQLLTVPHNDFAPVQKNQWKLPHRTSKGTSSFNLRPHNASCPNSAAQGLHMHRWIARDGRPGLHPHKSL